jgi:small subunit ribosomal protein S17
MTAMTAQAHAATDSGPARRQRSKRVGVVTSTARQKTIRVTVEYSVRHPKYGKYIRRQTVLHAHDEKSECRNGDVVELAQCRPLSKTKSWRLVRVVRRGAGGEGGAT